MENDIIKYYNFYLENKSIAKTAKHFNKCTKYLKKWFVENNFKYPLDNFNRKNNLNDKYFDNIDNQNKAYIVGFIYADGCIASRTRRKNDINYTLSFNLKENDIEILNFIKNELESNCKLYYKKEEFFIAPSGKEYLRNPQYSLSISCNYLCKRLLELGVYTKKSKKELNIPKLDNILIKHFIRGYFDGDGCVSLSKQFYKNSIYKKCSVNFTCNSINFLKEISNILQMNNIACGISSKKYNNTYTLKISQNKENLKLFFNYLYNDANFFLKRKYNKFCAHFYSDVKIKQGELLGSPTTEIVNEDNQQPSLTGNSFEGSTTNIQILSNKIKDGNDNTSALPLEIDSDGFITTYYNDIMFKWKPIKGLDY